MYLRSINHEPLLAAEEERALFAAGDKERLVKANLRLIFWHAKHYEGRGVALLDLVQEGNAELVRCVGKFEPSQGARFATYLIPCVRGVMRDMVLANSAFQLPANRGQILARLKRIEERMLTEGPVSVSELAAAADIDETELQILLRADRRAMSLEESPLSAEDEGLNFADMVADDDDTPEEAICREEDIISLRNAVAMLPKAQQEIVNRHYRQGQSYREMAAELGQPSRTLCNHEHKALEVLKMMLAYQDPISGQEIDDTDLDYYTGVTLPDPAPVQAAQTEPFRGQCGICLYVQTESKRQYCRVSGYNIGTNRALFHCIYQPEPD